METDNIDMTTTDGIAVSENSETTDAVNKDAECTDHNEELPEADVVETVAIPYIQDGDNNVHLFHGSIFRKSGEGENEKAIYSAEKYFFTKFAEDDEPKWDGVFVCLYNLTRNEVLKNDGNMFVEKREFMNKWLWNDRGSMENVTFNVKCTMPRVWASQFQSLLRRMEEYGNAGRSGQLGFYADGNGIFHPRFSFSSEFEKVDGRSSRYLTTKVDELFDAG